MTPFETVLLVFAVVLALTMLSVVVRMIIGPTILDRAVATDMLVVLLVIGMALYTAEAGAAWAGPALLGLTGLAFIATVAFARFVAREDPGGRAAQPGAGDDTGTGVFAAIDPRPAPEAATAQDDAAEQAAAAEEVAAEADAEGEDARGEDTTARETTPTNAAPAGTGIPLNAHEDEDPRGARDAGDAGAPGPEDEGLEDEEEAGFGLEDGEGRWP